MGIFHSLITVKPPYVPIPIIPSASSRVSCGSRQAMDIIYFDRADSTLFYSCIELEFRHHVLFPCGYHTKITNDQGFFDNTTLLKAVHQIYQQRCIELGFPRLWEKLENIIVFKHAEKINSNTWRIVVDDLIPMLTLLNK